MRTKPTGSSSDASDLGRLALLADEQASLRRIATLVARGVSAAEVFDAVAEEVHGLLHPEITNLARREPDGSWTYLALRGQESDAMFVGRNFQWDEAVPGQADIFSGRSIRGDAAPYGSALDDTIRAERMAAWVVSPIVLMSRTWGGLAVISRHGPLPVGTEERLAGFGELVATAIANAETRAELVASRARIVAAGDQARRRIQRDLHDGAQQRVVTLALKARALASSDAARASDLDTDFVRLAADLDDLLQELRDISSGLHPAVLSHGGLQPALKALARRSPIPVALDVGVSGRLAEPLEIAAYYLVAEMLTNAAKHANAAHVDVTAVARDGALRVCVRDDGVGGADPAGSGLVGLSDRVQALGGTMTIDSPPGAGTTLVAELPCQSATRP